MNSKAIQVALRSFLAIGAFAVAGCNSDKFEQGSFVTSLPPLGQLGSPSQAVQQEYRIGPLDRLNINVFQMKDLSLEKVQVDSGGKILLPLIGQVTAQGQTASELAKDIADRLGKCCLQNPQVIVLVEESIGQQITVTGAVVESNVYTIRGRTTLLKAITMAKGPDRQTANLKRVAVYRMKDGQRVGALFNVENIRAGLSEDPEILGGDTIIVDSSNTKSTWREIVSAVPFFGIFTYF